MWVSTTQCHLPDWPNGPSWLQEFDYSVKDRIGQCNIVPDTLSHNLPDVSSLPLLALVKSQDSSTTFSSFPIEWSDIAKSQQDDPEVQEVANKARSLTDPNPSHIHYLLKNGFLFHSMPDGQKGPKLQLVIPACLWKDFLAYAHDNLIGGHLGRLKTLLRLVDICYWPKLRSDVWKYCKKCQVCQEYKPSISKLASHMQSTSVLEPGHMLGFDPSVFGIWPRNSVHFPTPPFVCKQWSVIQKLTTTAHPQTNLSERVNRTLQTMISSYIQYHHRHWDR